MAYLQELLAPGEVVVVAERQHWIAILRRVAGALVLALLAVVMATLYGVGGWGGTSRAGAWAGAVLLAIAVLVALPAVLRWWNELYVVTDRRVLRVEGVLRKQALDSLLAKINDVRVTQTAPGRMLGYGTLEIVTASESSINRLDLLPRPLQFKRALMTASAAREGGAMAAGVPSAAGATARSAADRLAELADLRQRGLLSEEEYQRKRAEIVGAL